MDKDKYSCKTCGLHYESKELANKCYAWCSNNPSCNLGITKYSVEAKEAKQWLVDSS